MNTKRTSICIPEEEFLRLRSINAELVAALEAIARASPHKEDPKLTAEFSMGNYDDVFSDGYTQAEYHAAAVARAALAKAKEQV